MRQQLKQAFKLIDELSKDNRSEEQKKKDQLLYEYNKPELKRQRAFALLDSL